MRLITSDGTYLHLDDDWNHAVSMILEHARVLHEETLQEEWACIIQLEESENNPGILVETQAFGSLTQVREALKQSSELQNYRDMGACVELVEKNAPDVDLWQRPNARLTVRIVTQLNNSELGVSWHEYWAAIKPDNCTQAEHEIAQCLLWDDADKLTDIDAYAMAHKLTSS